MDGPVAVITDSYYHVVWNDTKAAIELSEGPFDNYGAYLSG